jgi:hypothetical protein
MELLVRFIWAASFDPPAQRFYDLELDHWGFARIDDESLGAMHDRLTQSVKYWWDSNTHSIYDNSIAGAEQLSTFAPNPSQHTYFFTMAFCATVPFPNTTLDNQDINSFFDLFPLDRVLNPFGLWGKTLPMILDIFAKLPFLPKLRDFARWFTEVANRHLGTLGYYHNLPQPGTQVPRPDMLPLFYISAYAMGGFQLDGQQVQVLGGVTSEEFQRSDGIVNTLSMSGPVAGPFGQGRFPSTGDISGAKGKYWFLGENATIDHADQIGVFTSEETVSYQLSCPGNLVLCCESTGTDCGVYRKPKWSSCI